MTKTDEFDPIETRAALLKRGPKPENVVPYSYRPFDVRWLYWELKTKLLDRNRAEYWPHASGGNLALSAQQKPRGDWQSSQVVQAIACLDLIDRGSSNFPLSFRDAQSGVMIPNISMTLKNFITERGLEDRAVFFNAVATMHAPSYRAENEGALRMDWPRVPIPGDAATLGHSAKLGETLSLLLNPESPAQGVTSGTLRPGLRVMGLSAKRGGAALDAADLALTAGWGYFQVDKKTGNRKTMAGQGATTHRAYTSVERVALDAEARAQDMTLNELLALIGVRTVDVFLNANTWWANVPENVWGYSLGGYQVIKKWLSYREHGVLGRPLKPDEALYVSQMVRRIAAILMLGPALDANYRAAAANAQSYEALGLSRDAARERKDAKVKKRGASRKLTPAMRSNRENAKKGKRDKKERSN